MKGIHPDLRKVANLALQISPIDFVITEGKRDLETQRKYVMKGVSKTMKSRHLHGFAVDFVAIVDGVPKYQAKAMRQVADAFKEAANELGIPINWGGDWKTFVDTPHIELSKSKYPDPQQ